MCACVPLHLVWQNGILPHIHFSRSVSAMSCEPVYHYNTCRHLGKGVTGVWCFLEVHRVHRPWEDPAAIRLGAPSFTFSFLTLKAKLLCQFWLRHNFLNLIFKIYFFFKKHSLKMTETASHHWRILCCRRQDPWFLASPVVHTSFHYLPSGTPLQWLRASDFTALLRSRLIYSLPPGS